MAWSNSKIFTVNVRDTYNRTASHVSTAGLDTAVVKMALFGTGATPDQTAINTLTGYNQATSQWVTGNEVTATGWTAGGLALTITSSSSGVVYTLTCANRSGGATDTVTAAFGCLVYNSSIATTLDGICFNYFGGSNSVTSGTFTVQPNASGLLTMTV